MGYGKKITIIFINDQNFSLMESENLKDGEESLE